MITITIIRHDLLLWRLHKNIHMADTFNMIFLFPYVCQSTTLNCS